MLDKDSVFKEEFKIYSNDMNNPEANKYTPEVLDDTYLVREFSLPCNADGSEFAHVAKRVYNNQGIPIGITTQNPYLDNITYEVGYTDGRKGSLFANTIVECMHTQINDEDNYHVLFEHIIDHCNDGQDIKADDVYIYSSNDSKCYIQTAQGIERLFGWKDKSTTWEGMKDVKQRYTVQLTTYAVEHKINIDSTFKWWVPYILRKQDCTISKI